MRSEVPSGRLRRDTATAGPRPTVGRALVATGGIVALVVGTATPAGAHSVGAGADLPLPIWLVAYLGAFALLIVFLAVRATWEAPRLAAGADGVALPPWADRLATVGRPVLQSATLVLFLVTLAAAWFGPDAASLNIAPIALYVMFWAGLQIVTPIVGDVWRHANPLHTVAAAIDRFARRDPARDDATGFWATHWPAAAGLLAFVWMLHAYHFAWSTSPIALFLGLYTGLLLVGATWFGAGWIRTGDGFAVLFQLLGSLAPIHRGVDGRLRLRAPGAGLATVEIRPGTMAVVTVVLGSVVFEGVEHTAWWTERTEGRIGWDLTMDNTMGLLATIAVVAAASVLICRLLAMAAGTGDGPAAPARHWVPALLPIMLGYAVAHHFSWLIFEGQAFIALVSDPFGQGWDLFGTAGNLIDFTVVSNAQIAWVQVAAIVVGHAAATVVVRDRAVERYDEGVATRAQLPVLAVMVASTVGGLLLFLNA